ncbi:MAG TPA: hypothetical protein DIT01_11825 [Lentisphaeria bacterium]|nr:hypothetical protein [Lentisphaeria bacterium]
MIDHLLESFAHILSVVRHVELGFRRRFVLLGLDFVLFRDQIRLQLDVRQRFHRDFDFDRRRLIRLADHQQRQRTDKADVNQDRQERASQQLAQAVMAILSFGRLDLAAVFSQFVFLFFHGFRLAGSVGRKLVSAESIPQICRRL